MAEISAKLLISKADQSFQTFIRGKVKYSLMSQGGTAADPQETESPQNIYSCLCLGFAAAVSLLSWYLIPGPFLPMFGLFQIVLPVYWSLLQNFKCFKRTVRHNHSLCRNWSQWAISINFWTSSSKGQIKSAACSCVQVLSVVTNKCFNDLSQ